MDGPGDEFLAGAGFAEDQHGGIAWARLSRSVVAPLHRRPVADQLRFAFDAFQLTFQGTILVGQFAFLGHACSSDCSSTSLHGLVR